MFLSALIPSGRYPAPILCIITILIVYNKTQLILLFYALLGTIISYKYISKITIYLRENMNRNFVDKILRTIIDYGTAMG